jgi:RNA polymerase sigma-70 factor (ECF subfamily)
MDFAERMARARGGERPAVDQLLAEWRPWLRRQARGILTSAAAHRVDSSDVVQNTLVEAFRHLPRFRGESPGEFANWLRQILRHQAAAQQRFHTAARRHMRRECPESGLPGDGSPLPSAALLRAERSRRLQDALAELPASLRDVVVGRVFHDQTFNDLADQLGRTPRIVRRQWTEALRHLAAAMHGLTTSQDGGSR